MKAYACSVTHLVLFQVATHLSIHSLNDSFFQWFIHSMIHSFDDSLIQWFLDLLSDILQNVFTYLLICNRIHLIELTNALELCHSSLPSVSSHSDEGDFSRCSNEASHRSSWHSHCSLRQETRRLTIPDRNKKSHQYTCKYIAFSKHLIKPLNIAYNN